MQNHRLTLLFLFPLCYRPLKVNFAKKFELLSDGATGHIFALSGKKIRNLEIANFRFHSEPDSPKFLSRSLRRIRVQTFLPLGLLWRKSHVDAVIAYDPYSSALSAIVLKILFRTPMILEINGDYHKMDQSEHFFKKWLMRLMFHISIRCADAIKVLNGDQERFLKGMLPSKAVYRFPNFVATEYFQSLKCSRGDYLLSVGYPFDLKGMDLLIRAFKVISGRHPGAKLRIMGYCPEGELIRYRQLAGNDQNIQFIKPGWIEDVGEQLRMCYALVNAAWSEGMGRIHVEAMACGKPIVATRTSGASECVEDGRTGLLCEIGNVKDLSEKLDHLFSNPRMADEMGQAGLERLRNEFSEDKYARSFLAMVQELVSSCREGLGS